MQSPYVNPALRTILAVDDNLSVTKILRHVPIDRSYSVVTAAGGGEALVLAKEQIVDAALIDVRLPGMNGFDLCRALREQVGATGRIVPVWLITGAPTAEIHQHAAEVGALAVLAKPFGIEELARRLEEQFGLVPAEATSHDETRLIRVRRLVHLTTDASEIFACAVLELAAFCIRRKFGRMPDAWC